MALDPALRARLNEAGRGEAPVAYVLMADLRALRAAYDAQAARLAAYQAALETIRDLDPLAGGVRSGAVSIGDTALAIANGLGRCQQIAITALEAIDAG